jgi:hypothetical protein
MPETVGGIPLHPLVVHAAVVLIPLAALGVGAVSLVPRWRDRYGGLVVTVAVLGSVLGWAAKESGQNLKEIVGESDLVDRHAQLGQTILWGVVPLAVLAVVLWWLGRRDAHGRPVARGGSIAIGTAGLVVAIAVLVQVVLIGHAGAKAAWG